MKVVLETHHGTFSTSTVVEKFIIVDQPPVKSVFAIETGAKVILRGISGSCPNTIHFGSVSLKNEFKHNGITQGIGVGKSQKFNLITPNDAVLIESDNGLLHLIMLRE